MIRRRRRPGRLPSPRQWLALALAACAVVLAAESGSESGAGSSDSHAAVDAHTNHNNAKEAPSGAPTPSDRQDLQGTAAGGAGDGSRGNRKPANRRRGPAPIGAPKHTVNNAAKDPTARPSVDVPRPEGGRSEGRGGVGYRPTVRSADGSGDDGSTSNNIMGGDSEEKKRHGLTNNNHVDNQQQQQPQKKYEFTKDAELAFEYRHEYGTDAFSREIDQRFQDPQYAAAEVHAFIKRRKAAKEDEHARIVREAQVVMAGKLPKEVAKFVERRKLEEREEDKKLGREVDAFVSTGDRVTPEEAAAFVRKRLEERRRAWDARLEALEGEAVNLGKLGSDKEGAEAKDAKSVQGAAEEADEVTKHAPNDGEHTHSGIKMEVRDLPPGIGHTAEIKRGNQKAEAKEEPKKIDRETVERLTYAQRAITKHASDEFKRAIFYATQHMGPDEATQFLIREGESLMEGLPDHMRDEAIAALRAELPKHMRREEDVPSSPPPAAQPTANAPEYQYAYESVYDEIFRPQMEEYDMTRFDPYSLSGAPIGGWGRATRSRLATLPIRLVSDFDGGMDLLFGGGSAENSEEAKDGGEAKAGKDGNGVAEGTGADDASDGKADASAKSTKVASASHGVQPSTGPHFSIHDSTGQKYVCRAYDEDELVVLSRIDSAFHPAVTVWDDVELASPESKILSGEEKGKGGDDPAALADDFANGGAHAKKHFHFSIHGGGVGGNVPEGIRASLSKMLAKMGMADAAEALAGEQELQDVAQAVANNLDELLGDEGMDVDVDVDVLVMDAEGALGDEAAAAVAEQEADELANIIKAAAVGAGMESVEDAKKGDDGGKKIVNKKRAAAQKPKTSPQLTSEEIYHILTRLNGLCSQLHLGWWSYEWCHQEQVRQFHVAVSTHPATFGKYDIEDVTLIGQFRREVQIIFPKAMYDGEMKKGRTETVVFNSKGIAAETHITPHTPADDEKYSGMYQFRPRDHILDNHQRHKEKMAKLGHGGPIVRHTFANGDLCEEAGRYRQMDVELRCCTEEEIDHWLKSKKQRPGQNEKDHQHGAMPGKPKAETPLAVLVGVQEDETCVYRSRVCTPLLCPKPIDGSASDGDASTSKDAISKQTADKIREQSKSDPFGALLTAVFGDDLANDAGQVEVFFPEGDIGEALDELVRDAEGGGDFINSPAFERVKEALRSERHVTKKFNLKELLGEEDAADGGSNAAPLYNSKVKETDSIRDILDMTLGKRPCLLKNLGWWTYEFCHAKQIRQYHANNLIDANTGFAKQVIETEHLLGKYENSGNSISDYPNEDEHLHVINATSSSTELQGMGRSKGKRKQKQQATGKNGKQPGGNGAVYVQEYAHGDVCDHEDVAESVIKGGNVVHGSVERSSTVRFSCGKRWEVIDIKEDSTCHYVVDVTVPELCQHRLFKAPVTKTQVVKCLPV